MRSDMPSLEDFRQMQIKANLERRNIKRARSIVRAGAIIRNAAVTLAAVAVVLGVAFHANALNVERQERNEWMVNCLLFSEIFEGQVDCYLLIETGTQSIRLQSTRGDMPIGKPALPEYGV